MKKRDVAIVCILLVIILLIPIPLRLKDGGTVVYKALAYSVSRVHRLASVKLKRNMKKELLLKF